MRAFWIFWTVSTTAFAFPSDCVIDATLGAIAKGDRQVATASALADYLKEQDHPFGEILAARLAWVTSNGTDHASSKRLQTLVADYTLWFREDEAKDKTWDGHELGKVRTLLRLVPEIRRVRILNPNAHGTALVERAQKVFSQRFEFGPTTETAQGADNIYLSLHPHRDPTGGPPVGSVIGRVYAAAAEPRNPPLFLWAYYRSDGELENLAYGPGPFAIFPIRFTTPTLQLGFLGGSVATSPDP